MSSISEDGGTGTGYQAIGDISTGKHVFTVTAIGAPVSASIPLQPDKREWKHGFMTDLTCQDYLDGKRTKFASKEQQERALEALPDLFLAINGSLSKGG